MTDRRTLGAAFGSVNLNGRLRYRYQNRLADTLRHIVADLRDSNIRKGAAPRSGLCSFVTGILRLLLNHWSTTEACFALLSSFTGYSRLVRVHYVSSQNRTSLITYLALRSTGR